MMGINRGLERKKFDKTQESLKKQYIDAGMTDEQIQAIYEFDLHQFNRDLSYRSHTQPLFSIEENDMEEEAHNSLLHKYTGNLSVSQQPTESKDLWWLDEIDDESLILGLMQLTKEELELIEDLAFRGLSQKEIARERGKSQSAISQNLATIRKKLKKAE